MIHPLISHNSQLAPVAEARLSPGQEGLINGWGIFTTLHAYHGQPFAFDRHWRRLQRDARRIHIPIPAAPEQLLADVLEVVRANQMEDGAIRIYIVMNRTGIWHSDEAFPDVDIVVTCAPLAGPEQPIRLDLREHGRHAASPLAGVKTIAWLNNVWNLYEAKQRGYDEVVLLNERGEVAECTAANIFAVRAGEALTPPLSSGCLAGITREVLLEVAPRAGVPVREAVLRPEDFYAADEVFVTSTNRGVLAVREIAGHTIAAVPGPLAVKLGEIFDAYVAEELAHPAGLAGLPEQPVAHPARG
jgi:branched-chain amino acid aminotransferase